MIPLLFYTDLIRASSFDIVSVHHQAVKTLAACFRATAFADDGIIEAFEWMEPEGKSYLNAVQWHPEKGDYHNELSQVIARDFIEAVLKFLTETTHVTPATVWKPKTA